MSAALGRVEVVVIHLPPGWAKRVERDLEEIKNKLGIVIENEEHIMDDQTHLDADVQALGTGLDAIEKEIAALKVQAPALDFTGLDAAVARLQGDAAPPPPAAEPVPAEVPAADTTPVA